MAKLSFVYRTDDEKTEWQKVDFMFICTLVFSLHGRLAVMFVYYFRWFYFHLHF